MLHPASLLLAWLGFALGLQWLTAYWLAGLAVISVVLAAVMAPERSLSLLRRSRWLLISLAVLYCFATPGEYVPGILGGIGLTYEGLQQGGEQLGRLLVMLSSLALLHQQVGTNGLLSGFHWLLKPFNWRQTTVVRLMLVLEYVEQKRHIPWREWLMQGTKEHNGSLPDYLIISMPRFHWVDAAVMLSVVGIMIFMMIRP